MKTYKTKYFAKWSKSAGLSDTELIKAVEEIKHGAFDADLGGAVIKKRVARQGEGKRGGYRTILAFKENHRAVFVFGFEKSAKSNITRKELSALKKLAKELLSYSDDEITHAIACKEIMEVQS